MGNVEFPFTIICVNGRIIEVCAEKRLPYGISWMSPAGSYLVQEAEKIRRDQESKTSLDLEPPRILKTNKLSIVRKAGKRFTFNVGGINRSNTKTQRQQKSRRKWYP